MYYGRVQQQTANKGDKNSKKKIIIYIYIYIYIYIHIYVNDQHIQIFDGLIDADSDSCLLNNFFDVRKE